MENKLGVVVAVFNVETYIEKCIRSIMNQSYPYLEIVIVNDGSTDQSGEICNALAKEDNRIQVIHQENRGLSAARYVGLCKVRAEYVIFADGDDWIAYNMYEKMMDIINREQPDVVASRIIRYFDDQNIQNFTDSIPAGRYAEKDLEDKVYPIMLWDLEQDNFGFDPSLCTKIMRKDIVYTVLKSQYKYSFYYGEDTALFYLVMLEMRTIVLVDEFLYYHRQRDRNQIPSYIMDETFFEKLLTVYQYMKSILIKANPKFQLIKQLDYFYMHSVNLKRRVYKDFTMELRYLFPFDKVKRGSKIALYGAGAVGQTYSAQLKKTRYCQVVAWVDKNYQDFAREDIESVEKIDCVDFEKVVIANASLDIINSVRKYLIEKGVSHEKIVW